MGVGSAPRLDARRGLARSGQSATTTNRVPGLRGLRCRARPGGFASETQGTTVDAVSGVGHNAVN